MLTDVELTANMVGVGLNFAAYPNPEADIEDTIFYASVIGMDKDDLRVLSVLVTWLSMHAQIIDANQLIQLVQSKGSERVRAFWAAFAEWKRNDVCFHRLMHMKPTQRIDLLHVGTDFHISRHGEDHRFKGTSLRVPSNVLRDRAADVLTPSELSQRHPIYRKRSDIAASASN